VHLEEGAESSDSGKESHNRGGNTSTVVEAVAVGNNVRVVDHGVVEALVEEVDSSLAISILTDLHHDILLVTRTSDSVVRTGDIKTTDGYTGEVEDLLTSVVAAGNRDKRHGHVDMSLGVHDSLGLGVLGLTSTSDLLDGVDDGKVSGRGLNSSGGTVVGDRHGHVPVLREEVVDLEVELGAGDVLVGDQGLLEDDSGAEGTRSLVLGGSDRLVLVHVGSGVELIGRVTDIPLVRSVSALGLEIDSLEALGCLDLAVHKLSSVGNEDLAQAESVAATLVANVGGDDLTEEGLIDLSTSLDGTGNEGEAVGELGVVDLRATASVLAGGALGGGSTSLVVGSENSGDVAGLDGLDGDTTGGNVLQLLLQRLSGVESLRRVSSLGTVDGLGTITEAGLEGSGSVEQTLLSWSSRIRRGFGLGSVGRRLRLGTVSRGLRLGTVSRGLRLGTVSRGLRLGTVSRGLRLGTVSRRLGLGILGRGLRLRGITRRTLRRHRSLLVLRCGRSRLSSWRRSNGCTRSRTSLFRIRFCFHIQHLHVRHAVGVGYSEETENTHQ